MAFAGLHVTSGYAGSLTRRADTFGVLGRVVWSETLASPATTTNVAPPISDGAGEPMFQVKASADSYVAIGAAPNATTGARILVSAGERLEFYAQPGDKLAWIAA